MVNILLGENYRPLSAAHVSILLLIICSAVVATLWFLVVIYIALSSAKSDPFTQLHKFPKMANITTRKRVTFSTSPCRILKSVCLLCDVVPPSNTLICLSFSGFLMVSSILPWILIFSICLLPYVFSMSKKIETVFNFV